MNINNNNSNRKKILICEEVNQKFNDYDIIIQWSSYYQSTNIISIPRVLENDSEKYKELYLSWLSGLALTKINNLSILEHFSIRTDFSIWWMSLLAEKSVWKNPEIYDVFRLLVLDNLLDSYSFKSITLNIDNKLVHKSIKKWCADNNVKYTNLSKFRNKKIFSLKGVFYSLPHTIQATIYLLKYFLQAGIEKQEIVESDLARDDNSITITSYLFNLDINASLKGEYYSRYWTELHALLAGLPRNINWLHLYVKSKEVPTLAKGCELIAQFNKAEKQTHQIINVNMDWKVLCAVLKDFGKTWLIARRLKNIEQLFIVKNCKFNLWPLLKNSWKASFFGLTSMSNSIFLNIFEKMIFKLPRQRLGLYLLENQAWERALIYVWKKAKHGELLGVQHATVSKWDLRHFFSDTEYKNTNSLALPIPDKIAVNGHASLKVYSTTNFPIDKLTKAEALRYMYHDKLQKIQTKNYKNLRLLVLGDYLISQTNKQLELLRKSIKFLPDNIEIIFKPHPATPIDVKKWPSLKLQLISDPLDQLTDIYDIAYASNLTSAAVDVYLAGKKVLVHLDPNFFNMSPLCGCSGVEFVSSSDSIVKALSEFDKSKTWAIDEFFYANHDLPYWRLILEDTQNRTELAL